MRPLGFRVSGFWFLVLNEQIELKRQLVNA
jgi:hypothetical protein